MDPLVGSSNNNRAVSMSRLTCDEIAESIAENEACLVEFFSSGEPETTSMYEFRQVHQPLNIRESSETAGCGLFLEGPAQPGDLLIVDNAVDSCACTREYTPYKEDSYIHAPKADWKPPRPRVPPRVQEDLINKLIVCSSAPTDTRADLDPVTNGLKSLDSRFADSSSRCKSSDPQNRRFLSWRDENPEASSCHRSQPDDLPRRLKNVVTNNAICSKVRSLSLNEPPQVETLEWWGVWLLVSYINHSCAPNCHRMRVGEAMFIRAATDIAAGEELTVPYFDIFEPLAIRDAHCQTFGFRCECCRCSFERSLGTPYTDIQTQIVQLKMQLQTEWTVNATASDGKANILLHQLADLVFPVNIYASSEEIDVRPTRRHTKSTKRASKLRKKDHMSKKRILQQCWIEASFVDAYIAMYAVCAARPFTGMREGFDPILYLESLKPDIPITRTEVGQVAQRMIYASVQVLDIVAPVHPGNMLGQEFYSIGVKAYRQLLNCDESELELSQKSEDLERFIMEGICFYSRYYGCSDEPILLEELLEMES